jgi:TetR/AcrR family transcriptional regulator, transcriptional repressor for nem operon
VFFRESSIEIISTFAYRSFSIFNMNDTREYIIEKAFKLFLAKSYEAVSISDISNAIGLTKGALYHHFASKEELFKAVIDKRLTITPVSFDFEKGTVKEFIEETLKHAEAILRKILTDEFEIIPLNYVSLITDSFRHYPGYADEKIKMMNEEAGRIKSLLQKAIKSGEIRDDLNVDSVSSIFVSTMVGMAGLFIEKKSIEKMIEMLQLQFDEIYRLIKK